MSPVPYGMTPGERHELPGITVPSAPPAPDEINLDEAPPSAPYGMEPGKRHFLPGITPLLQQSSPLSGAPPQAPAQPQVDESQYRDANGHEYGISFMLDGKRVELKPNLEASSEHRGRQINELGQALMKHAHTDAEKEAAERAAAWGLAQADTDIPLEHVMKSMDESYRKDTGYEAALAKQALVNQGKMDAVHAAHPWGLGGGSGSNLKQDKFDFQVNHAHSEAVGNLVESERRGYDFKKGQDALAAYDGIASMMESDNAGSQQLAIGNLMLALTGKQATARERAAIENMNGAWDHYVREIRSLFPNPEVTEGFKRQFLAAVNQARQAVAAEMADNAERSVARLHSQLWWGSLSPEEQAQAEADVRGAMGGDPTVRPIAAIPAPGPSRSPAAPKKGYNIRDYVGH